MDKRLLVIFILAVVLALIVYRKVSGFTPQPGQPISMMDLQEFSYLSLDQKNKYSSLMTQQTSNLQSYAQSQNFTKYKQTLDMILQQAIKTPSSTTPPVSNVCSNVIVMGDCLNTNTCPSGMSPMSVGTLKYCVCPGNGVLMMSQTGPPVCQAASTCPTGMRTLSESPIITGQKACASVCPPTIKPGYTCT